jgi:lysozyme
MKTSRLFDRFIEKSKLWLHRSSTLGFTTPLVKHFETYAPRPYVCEGGKLTIGYGHVMKAGDPKYLTEREAYRLLMSELRKSYYPATVSALDTENIDAYSLKSWELGALVSAVYNTGPAIILEGSWIGFWKQEDMETAESRFYLWNKAGGKTQPGLVRRRMSEWQLFTTGTWENEPTGWREMYERLK